MPIIYDAKIQKCDKPSVHFLDTVVSYFDAAKLFFPFYFVDIYIFHIFGTEFDIGLL